MKLNPLVLAFAGAGIASVNAIPLRVTLVSSSNQIGPAGNFFDPPPPSVRSEDGVYRIQVVPPTATRRRPCHSMSDSAVGIANRFRKLFGFDQIEAHPAVENHHYPHHAKLVPIESVATKPVPDDGEMHILPFNPVPNDGEAHIMPFHPVPDDGEMHILPFRPILDDGEVHIMPATMLLEDVKNLGAQPVHRHSHHRHHRLQDAPFMERLSHSLAMLGRWEGRAIAFVLGCGIGVVLRMIYVLIVVTYRMFRGPAQPGEDDADEEETEVLLVAAPLEYGKDEKVAL